MYPLPTKALHFHVNATVPGAEPLVLTFAQGLPALASARRLVDEARPAGATIGIAGMKGHLSWHILGPDEATCTGTVTLLACADPDCHHAQEAQELPAAAA